MPASHEDVGHRPLPSHLEERGLDRRPVLVLVERDGGDLLRTELLEERLGLGAERAARLGEEDDGRAEDELPDPRLERAWLGLG